MMKDLAKGAAIGIAAILVLLLASVALAAVPDHVRSWTQAVNEGLIEGDPAYYSSGDATVEEYGHALITSILDVDERMWVPPIPGATLDDPGSFCAEKMWEYRYDASGLGYRPQAFADTWTYDSITMFDDVYGPVTYLDPKLGHLYQHPAGGYDRIIICMAKEEM